jgi:hypothetical protein
MFVSSDHVSGRDDVGYILALLHNESGTYVLCSLMRFGGDLHDARLQARNVLRKSTKADLDEARKKDHCCHQRDSDHHRLNSLYSR